MMSTNDQLIHNIIINNNIEDHEYQWLIVVDSIAFEIARDCISIDAARASNNLHTNEWGSDRLQ